jgi:hypothetical protein
MRNWGIDTTELEKDPESFTIWKLEQLINFGTGGEKIDEKELRRYFDRLVIDKNKKRFISFLLWGENYLKEWQDFFVNQAANSKKEILS